MAPAESMRGAKHWFNHIQINRDGSRFGVLHRWQPEGRKGHVTRLLVGDPFTGQVRIRHDESFFSHYDWLGNDDVVGYARVPDAGGKDDRDFLVLPAESREYAILAPGTFSADGHNSFSPDRQWMLNDNSYSREGSQGVMLYRLAGGPRVDIAEFAAEWIADRPLRCDLHPRWNRAGNRVCVDSLCDGTRQMYVVDASEVVAKAF